MKIWIWILVLGCAWTSQAGAAVNVVTTTGQITDAVAFIGGEHVRVEGLMGPGVDPHLYRASESDVRRLSSADIIFYNGLFLEAKMEDIFERMARFKTVVAVGESVPEDQLLESVGYAGHHDPHIWFDVPLWQHTVQRIMDTLIEKDPEHRDFYLRKGSEYMEQLQLLHAYVEEKASELKPEQRVLVTAHDAFRYFGRAYGFEVVGLQGISTESEAGTRDVRELADFIVEKQVKAIFVESSVSERSIKAVQEAVRSRGWEVAIGGELFSDALGSTGTPQGTYVGMVRHNINTIVDALK